MVIFYLQSGLEEFRIHDEAINSLQEANRRHPELYVLLAEAAFATDHRDVARQTLETFLYSEPQRDQFYCRAKFMMAMVLNFEAKHCVGTESIQRCKTALVHVMDALDVALAPDNSRYKFLVFNASITCWLIVHKFLRPEFAHHFLPEMQRICTALETVDDQDINWRMMYASATAYCLEDDKQPKPAADMVDQAIEYAETFVSKTAAIEENILLEIKNYTKESEDLINNMRKLQDVKKDNAKDSKKGKSESHSKQLPHTSEDTLAKVRELTNVLEAIQRKKAIATTKLREIRVIKEPQLETLTSLYMQRIHSNPSDAKKVSSGGTYASKSVRASVLLQLQQIKSGCIAEKDWISTFQAIQLQLEAATASPVITETALDACRYAWQYHFHEIAIKFQTFAETDKSLSPLLRAKLDTCIAIRMMEELEREELKDLKNTQRLSQRQLEGKDISRRIEAVKLIERVLSVALKRISDNCFIEEVCIYAWNFGYPLLQPHLRTQIHNLFQLASTALEQIASPMLMLRAQFHLEVAKCEELSDYVIKAKNELEKALSLDYGILENSVGGRPPSARNSNKKNKVTTVVETKRTDELDELRPLDRYLKPFLQLMVLKCDVYGIPSTPEDIVSSMLQQIKDNHSKAFQADVLVRACTVIFDYILSPSYAHKDSTGMSLVPIDTKKRKLPPTLSLEEIEKFITIDRTSPGVSCQPFLYETQRLVYLINNLTKLAYSFNYGSVIEQGSKFMMGIIWDISDALSKDLIIIQIDTLYLLAEHLVRRLSTCWLNEREELIYEDANEDEPDPRSLGIHSKYESAEMTHMKKLILLSLKKGLEMSLLINDEICTQNGLIYFWNLHLHISRNNLYGKVTSDFTEFLKKSLEALEYFASNGVDDIDDRIKSNLYECYVRILLMTPSSTSASSTVKGGVVPPSQGQVPGQAPSSQSQSQNSLTEAYDIAMKACQSNCSIYSKRRLCELANEINYQIQITKNVKTMEPVKFDNPLMSMYGYLYLLEVSEIPTDQLKSLCQRGINLMEIEVTGLIKGYDKTVMTLEQFNQLAEIQAECWTRLTKAGILVNDVHTAQQAAEKCMELVSEDLMSEVDKNKLSPRVWRWISVCERYFGVAIGNILNSDGQDKSLQFELRLAALRHFSLSCQFGLKSGVDELVVAAGKRAWEVSKPLIDELSVRSSLFQLQHQILNCLLDVKSVDANILKQQFYSAMIGGQIQLREWDEALNTILEAFENVPISLQKSLWQWRVIVLSKKGKNVLDGIQKLKESDASLQARVYAIVARSSSNPKQQLEAYLKALEILNNDYHNKFEYLLEMAQWLASTGFPKSDAMDILNTVLDDIFELDDFNSREKDEDDDSKSKSHNSTPSLKSSKSSKSTPSSPSQRSKSPLVASVGGSDIGKRDGKASPSAKSRGRNRSSRASSIRKPGANAVEVKIDLLHCDIGMRCGAMMAILEHDASQRINDCLMAAGFVRRSLITWGDAMQETYRHIQYMKLPALQKEVTPYETFTATPPDTLIFPTDPIDLIKWSPSEEFYSYMALAVEKSPFCVPTDSSITCLPLTYYYAIWLAESLHCLNSPKNALLCLGWIRLLFFHLPGTDIEYPLGAIHFKTMKILHSVGLYEEALALPRTLGNTSIECTALVSTISNRTESFANMNGSSSTANLSNKNNGDDRSICGILCRTEDISNFNPLQCSIDICQDCVELGQENLCRSALQLLYKDCISSKYDRGIVLTTLLLSEICLKSGQPESVISKIFSIRSELNILGDPIVFSKFVSLLCAAYVEMGQNSQAKSLALSAMKLYQSKSIQTLTYPERVMDPINKEIMKDNANNNLRVTNRALDIPNASIDGSSKHDSVQSFNSKGLSTIASQSVADVGIVKKAKNETVAPAAKTTAINNNNNNNNLANKNTIVISTERETFAPKQELSYECAVGLSRISSTYLNILRNEALEMIENDGFDIRVLFVELNVHITTVLDVLEKVLGQSSTITADLLAQHTENIVTILLAIHNKNSNLISISNYSSWLDGKIVDCINYNERVVDTYRSTYALIPFSEKTYERDSDGNTNDSSSEIIYLNYQCINQLAKILTEISKLQLFLAIIRKEDISIYHDIPDTKLNVIEEYLEKSEPRNEFIINDFNMPCIYKALLSISSAIQLIGSFEETIEMKILELVASTIKLSKNGELDEIWKFSALVEPPRRDSIPQGSDAVGRALESSRRRESFNRSNTPALLTNSSSSSDTNNMNTTASSDINKIRTELLSLFTNALMNRNYVAASEAGLTIANLYGNTNTFKTVCHLMYVQSISAREWLLKIWMDALSPSSAIAQSLKRLQAIENKATGKQKYLNKKACNLELAFLQHNSICWRR